MDKKEYGYFLKEFFIMLSDIAEENRKDSRKTEERLFKAKREMIRIANKFKVDLRTGKQLGE